MQHDPLTFQAVPAILHNLGNPLIKRIRKGNVADHTLLKESPRPEPLGAVNDLVGDDKVPGLDLLLQATHGGKGDDGAHSDGAQGSNIRTGRDLMRSQLMVQTVATEECDGDKLAGGSALVVQDGDWGRGVTPRRRDGQRRNLGKTREFSKTSTTNHGNADGVYISQSY